MFILLIKMFIIAFFLNFIWEWLHSPLYITCNRLSKKKKINRILLAALSDGAWIGVFAVISIFAFGNEMILEQAGSIILFLVLCLGFAYIYEKDALSFEFWEYTDKMPLILGVGVSPLLQLPVVGFISAVLASVI